MSGETALAGAAFRRPVVTLSIVSSMYRSEAFLAEFYARCTAAATQLAGSSYEIILVNDGSPDRSLQIAIDLHDRDPHVRVIDLSRNFGHHKALMTGLAHARGDLVFLIDCDLEEDPAWLLTFHDTMRANAVDVVYGVQGRRKGDWFERVTGQIYFGLFNRMLTYPIQVNVVTARLMTARYVKALVSHRERELLLSGLWAITGFEQHPITIQKGSRPDSSYTTRMRLSMFANAITSFSNRPLIYIFQIGMAVMALSVVAAIVLLYMSLNGRIGVPGWASIMVSIWFLGGLIIFCVGVIGMYLAKIFIEIKQRPYTIVRAEYGSGQEGPAGPTGPALRS
jgi:putative glycosyltransferase